MTARQPLPVPPVRTQSRIRAVESLGGSCPHWVLWLVGVWGCRRGWPCEQAPPTAGQCLRRPSLDTCPSVVKGTLWLPVSFQERLPGPGTSGLVRTGHVGPGNWVWSPSGCSCARRTAWSRAQFLPACWEGHRDRPAGQGRLTDPQCRPWPGRTCHCHGVGCSCLVLGQRSRVRLPAGVHWLPRSLRGPGSSAVGLG